MTPESEQLDGVPDPAVVASVLDRAAEAYFTADRRTHAIRWFGCRPGRLLGYEDGQGDFPLQGDLDRLHPDDREDMEVFRKLMWNGRAAQIEVRMRNAEGDWQWIHLATAPAEEEAQLMVGFVRDTQPYHEREREALEHLGRERIGTLAEGLAHEFNNLLTPIRGFIELALDRFNPADPAADGLRTALDQVERCAQLVAQIQLSGRRSFVRPERIHPERVLPSIARVALSSYRGSGRRYRLKLEWRPRLPPIRADRIQFQEAIVQLLKNAVEAMPQGGTLTVRAEPVRAGRGIREGGKANGTRSGRFMRIDVIDTGCGMTQEVLDHALDPFFTTHSRAGKRGMGLPMVRGMVEQHGGWLELETRPGKGTRVSLFLPLDETARESGVEEDLPDEDGTLRVLPAAPVGKVLVGDDDDLVRELVARTFEGEGWHVKTVDGFDKVLRLVEEGGLDFDVAVLDLTMAGGKVEEVLERVQEAAPEMLVVMVSGFGYDELVARLIRQGRGRVSYLAKPFSPSELLQRVDEMFAGEPVEGGARRP